MKEQDKLGSTEADALQRLHRTNTGGLEPGLPSMVRFSVSSQPLASITVL